MTISTVYTGRSAFGSLARQVGRATLLTERDVVNVADVGMVERIRAFNRFYTGQIGVLTDRLLDSDYSLAEVRVLLELSHGEEVTASDLVVDLGLDSGYLSRMLQRFDQEGLISREPAADDRRRRLLSLTPGGKKVFGRLNHRAGQEIRAMLADVRGGFPADQALLIESLQRARHHRLVLLVQFGVPDFGDLHDEIGWHVTYDYISC